MYGEKVRIDELSLPRETTPAVVTNQAAVRFPPPNSFLLRVPDPVVPADEKRQDNSRTHH